MPHRGVTLYEDCHKEDEGQPFPQQKYGWDTESSMSYHIFQVALQIFLLDGILPRKNLQFSTNLFANNPLNKVL